MYIDEPALTYTYRQQLMELTAEQQPEVDNGWTALEQAYQQFPAINLKATHAAVQTDWSMSNAAIQDIVDSAILRSDWMISFREALSGRRLVRPFGSVGMITTELTPDLDAAQQTSTMLNRAALAAATRGQWDTSVDLLGLALRFAEIMTAQPTPAHSDLGKQMQHDALLSIRTALVVHTAPAATALQLQQLVSTDVDRNAAITNAIERQRIETLCELHWTHGSRGFILPQTGLLRSAKNHARSRYTTRANIGGDQRTTANAWAARWDYATRDQCIDLANQWFDAMLERAITPTAPRWDAWPPTALRKQISRERFAHLSFLLDFEPSRLDQTDALLFTRHATRLVAAIEAFRDERCRPPARLAELVPRYINSVPLDPLSGAAIVYSVQPSGLYTLRSMGPDGVDNRGSYPEDVRLAMPRVYPARIEWQPYRAR